MRKEKGRYAARVDRMLTAIRKTYAACAVYRNALTQNALE